MTFATIFALVVLDKSQVTLVANDNYRWIKEKVKYWFIHWPLTIGQNKLVACIKDYYYLDNIHNTTSNSIHNAYYNTNVSYRQM